MKKLLAAVLATVLLATPQARGADLGADLDALEAAGGVNRSVLLAGRALADGDASDPFDEVARDLLRARARAGELAAKLVLARLLESGAVEPDFDGELAELAASLPDAVAGRPEPVARLVREIRTRRGAPEARARIAAEAGRPDGARTLYEIPQDLPDDAPTMAARKRPAPAAQTDPDRTDPDRTDPTRTDPTRTAAERTAPRSEADPQVRRLSGEARRSFAARAQGPLKLVVGYARTPQELIRVYDRASQRDPRSMRGVVPEVHPIRHPRFGPGYFLSLSKIGSRPQAQAICRVMRVPDCAASLRSGADMAARRARMAEGPPQPRRTEPRRSAQAPQQEAVPARPVQSPPGPSRPDPLAGAGPDDVVAEAAAAARGGSRRAQPAWPLPERKPDVPRSAAAFASVVWAPEPAPADVGAAAARVGQGRDRALIARLRAPDPEETARMARIASEDARYVDVDADPVLMPPIPGTKPRAPVAMRPVLLPDLVARGPIRSGPRGAAPDLSAVAPRFDAPRRLGRFTVSPWAVEAAVGLYAAAAPQAAHEHVALAPRPGVKPRPPVAWRETPMPDLVARGPLPRAPRSAPVDLSGVSADPSGVAGAVPMTPSHLVRWKPAADAAAAWASSASPRAAEHVAWAPVPAAKPATPATFVDRARLPDMVAGPEPVGDWIPLAPRLSGGFAGVAASTPRTTDLQRHYALLARFAEADAAEVRGGDPAADRAQPPANYLDLPDADAAEIRGGDPLADVERPGWLWVVDAEFDRNVNLPGDPVADVETPPQVFITPPDADLAEVRGGDPAADVERPGWLWVVDAEFDRNVNLPGDPVADVEAPPQAYVAPPEADLAEARGGDRLVGRADAPRQSGDRSGVVGPKGVEAGQQAGGESVGGAWNRVLERVPAARLAPERRAALRLAERDALARLAREAGIGAGPAELPEFRAVAPAAGGDDVIFESSRARTEVVAVPADPAPAAARAEPPPGAFVQLGSFRTAAPAARESARLAGLLDGVDFGGRRLETRRLSGSAGGYHAVVLPGFVDVSAAEAFCARLRGYRVPCLARRE